MPPEDPPGAEAITAGARGGLLAAALLEDGHRVRLTVTGDSMGPLLASGDQVELAPLGGRPRRGQVVLARRADGSVLLHRLLRIRADGRVQTRGDAHWRLDDPLEAGEVLGRVVRFRKGRGNWQRAPLGAGAAARSLLALARSWLAYRLCASPGATPRARSILRARRHPG